MNIRLTATILSCRAFNETKRIPLTSSATAGLQPVVSSSCPKSWRRPAEHSSRRPTVDHGSGADPVTQRGSSSPHTPTHGDRRHRDVGGVSLHRPSLEAGQYVSFCRVRGHEDAPTAQGSRPHLRSLSPLLPPATRSVRDRLSDAAATGRPTPARSTGVDPTEQPVLGAYLEIVEAMLADRDHELYAGTLERNRRESGRRRRSSRVARLRSNAAQAARCSR